MRRLLKLKGFAVSKYGHDVQHRGPDLEIFAGNVPISTSLFASSCSMVDVEKRTQNLSWRMTSTIEDRKDEDGLPTFILGTSFHDILVLRKPGQDGR